MTPLQIVHAQEALNNAPITLNLQLYTFIHIRIGKSVNDALGNSVRLTYELHASRV